MFGVITLATSKGGVGKSSLGRSLAAHWFTVGHKPALVDADPQRIDARGRQRKSAGEERLCSGGFSERRRHEGA